MRTLAMPDSTKLVQQHKARGSLVAGAIADALGWPQEPNNRRSRIEKNSGQFGWHFQPWSRRVGGRYLEHEVKIAAGEYSDDTQLTLCTARSILAGERWLEHFSRVELPAFQLYERGSGRATKRAIESWLSGNTPWTQKNPSAREDYFNAGANGAMMRIVPHCLARLSDTTFEGLARDIFLNAVCTHGHPRALLGALCFGFSAWSSLRLNTTLRYGELLHLILNNREEWCGIPDTLITQDWLSCSPVGINQQKENWYMTIDEIIEAVEMCTSQLQMHSLSIEHDVLARLGAFTNQRGSGTITAIAAIFLASRFATEPTAGILEAAYADGADTDTLGSATGQILGAINGDEWLTPLSNEVQDKEYIRDIADRLLEGSNSDSLSIEPVSTYTLEKFKKVLATARAGEVIKFPDGRKCEVMRVTQSEAKSDKVNAKSALLKMQDGQELYVPIIKRTSGRKIELPESAENTLPVKAIRQTEKLPEFVIKIDPSLSSQRLADLEQTNGSTRSAAACQIHVTFIPTHCFLIQCECAGESGSRIVYKKDEAMRCLTDLGVISASRIVSDLSSEGDDRIERFSFKTDRREACKRWALNKNCDSDREKERLAKQWIRALINSCAAKRNLTDINLQIEDTLNGCTIRWNIGQKEFSVKLEIGQLVDYIFEPKVRRDVEKNIEKLLGK